MNIYHMILNELPNWLASKPQYGDVAYLIDDFLTKRYLYVYQGPDDEPYSHLISEEFATDFYMKEIDKLKVEETKMEKKCENCKYFEGTSFETKIQDYWCTHKKYSGTRIARHTSCPEYAPKEMKTTPFDGIKFYLKDRATGELRIKYICEDCGKEMLDAPDRWWLVLPLHNKPNSKPGYHFRCEDCDKKERR